MSVIYLFPGQGAQRAGILHNLPHHPEVVQTLAETSAALCMDVLQLDTEASLTKSFAVQICLLAAGVSMARVLAATGARPDMVAGMSIGAWPAAVVAGVLDYQDAVCLVALRGRLMDNAFPMGYGMAAISGLTRAQLEPMIAQVHGETMPVYLANLNAERQMVISGADGALAAVMELALVGGAAQAQRLAVSVPSHCELFSDVALTLKQALDPVVLRRAHCVYLSSSAARMLSDPRHIGEDLASNVMRQVHWHETVRLAWERGARLAVEMPGGSVLSRLTTPFFTDGSVICTDNNRIESVVALAVQYERRS